MNNFIFKYTWKSFLFSKKSYLNQILIITLLAAIISGSLLTGESVRTSLKKSSQERLGNTNQIANTGLRYFDASLSERLPFTSTPIVEMEGYCQNFMTGETALNVSIFGITGSFFDFHGKSGIEIQSGECAVNERLAARLGINVGDEIIIRFKNTNPIPENAPFAPNESSGLWKVLKVGRILSPEQIGNLSLGISQIVPLNIFMNISEFTENNQPPYRANRLLISQNDGDLESAVKENLTLSDIGLTMRKSVATGETEIISDRVFIDSSIVGDILTRIPGSYPLITYLVNGIATDNAETPYSFVSTIPPPPEFGPEFGYVFEQQRLFILGDDEIIISEWLANDLKVGKGDELTMRWFVPVGVLLEEIERKFIVREIGLKDNHFADSLLMPNFPGIVGQVSCSSWDAGIPILLDKIRDKDEEYWDRYRGTPKAFVNYKTGNELWNNIFGSATAIRFSPEITADEIESKLKGAINPLNAGFSFQDVKKAGESAATQGVDFGSLFLGLSFFILLSCIILLSFAVSIYIESKEEPLKILSSIGFGNKIIGRLIYAETGIIAVVGSMIGAFSGYAINAVIVKALNSVWTGAVQTDTITPVFSIKPIIYAFVATVIISQLDVFTVLRKYRKRVAMKRDELSDKNVSRLAVVFVGILAISFSLSVLFTANPPIIMSFSSGILLLLTFVLTLRQYYIINQKTDIAIKQSLYGFSKKFYAFNVSQAIAPVIFIASGIFAIIITSANKQAFYRRYGSKQRRNRRLSVLGGIGIADKGKP